MSYNWPPQTFEFDDCPGCPLDPCPPHSRAASGWSEVAELFGGAGSRMLRVRDQTFRFAIQ